MREDVTIIGKTLLAESWGNLTDYTIEVVREGVASRHQREVYDHGLAAALLLYAPEPGTVLLVRQFRMAAHIVDGDGWLIETCAGLLDGDDPETCARREAEEETGHRPEAVAHVFDAYMSPGSLTEKVHCFIGEYGPHTRVSDGGGIAHEGEHIELVELAFDDALAMARNGGIADAKTIMLLQHLAMSGLMRK